MSEYIVISKEWLINKLNADERILGEPVKEDEYYEGKQDAFHEVIDEGTEYTADFLNSLPFTAEGIKRIIGCVNKNVENQDYLKGMNDMVNVIYSKGNIG